MTETDEQRLIQAFGYFNDELFDGALPDCSITLQRRKGAYGYFAPEIFFHRSGDGKRDEIALNPESFNRSEQAILSTLAHEMVHLWQQHYGKPSRNGYHNKEWAAKMKAIGLQPVSADEPGKETGQRVTHMVVDGGAFAVACAAYLDAGWGLTWASLCLSGGARKSSGSKNKQKVGYVCAACGAKVWGRSGLSVICGNCNVPFVERCNEESEVN